MYQPEPQPLPRQRASLAIMIPLWIVAVPILALVAFYFIVVATLALPYIEVGGAMFFHGLLFGH